MLSPKESQLVQQTFYTPLRKDNSHEIMVVIHDVERGCIHRVYTDNHLNKHFSEQEELDALPKLGEFTTTTTEYNEVVKDAESRGILNKPLYF